MQPVTKNSEKISQKFNLIIVNFEKNKYVTFNLKQFVLGFFKSVAFFGTPGMSEKH